MPRPRRVIVLTLVVMTLAFVTAPTGALGQGDQMTWGVHISLAPTWFDPAESSGIAAPYMTYYALHYERAGEPFRQTDRLNDSERAMLMGGACASTACDSMWRT